jgi:hypothetical protein
VKIARQDPPLWSWGYQKVDRLVATEPERSEQLRPRPNSPLTAPVVYGEMRVADR